MEELIANLAVMIPGSVPTQDAAERIVRRILAAAAPHMREGEAFGYANRHDISDGVVNVLVHRNADKHHAVPVYTAPPKADAVDLAPGMMIIQKSDAECLVRDLERFATTKTAGGRLAMKRVRELLAGDSSRSKP